MGGPSTDVKVRRDTSQGRDAWADQHADEWGRPVSEPEGTVAFCEMQPLNVRETAARDSAAGMIANLFAGKGEPNGDDERVINRAGLDVRLIGGPARFQGMVRVNDWGPYDYHRDFNLTFPLQLMGDISYSLGPPEWFDLPQTRLGVRASVRSLNEHSPRYCPATSPDDFGRMACNPSLGSENGREWEVRTCLHIGL